MYKVSSWQIRPSSLQPLPAVQQLHSTIERQVLHINGRPLVSDWCFAHYRQHASSSSHTVFVGAMHDCPLFRTTVVHAATISRCTPRPHVSFSTASGSNGLDHDMQPSKCKSLLTHCSQPWQADQQVDQ